jgi:hypothetical protein
MIGKSSLSAFKEKQMKEKLLKQSLNKQEKRIEDSMISDRSEYECESEENIESLSSLLDPLCVSCLNMNSLYYDMGCSSWLPWE